MSLPSIMTNRFSTVPGNPVQRSSFDRSYNHKTTMDAGKLVPVFLQEILPGDTIALTATFFGRVDTLAFPIMDNLHFDTFFFFVPNRLVWDNWKKFNGERANPSDSIDFEIPYISGEAGEGGVYSFAPFSIFDYMGLPVGRNIDSDLTHISALPWRMYNLIYNEWFRDQNLQPSISVPTGDGPDEITSYAGLNYRGKRHDYITSCLVAPQKGDAVALPIGTSAPVIGDGNSMGFEGNSGEDLYLRYTDGTGTNGLLQAGTPGGAIGSSPAFTGVGGNRLVGLNTDPTLTHIYADLSSATAATINDLREAFAVQQLLEMDSRGGTRYREQLLSMWGVTIPDATLQRPEYLGGSTDGVNIHQVAQTAGDIAPVGTLSAYGQISCRAGFNHSFSEHGYVIGIANIRADIGYQECIDRHWTRATRYDFYMPPFAHLGEQPVYEREVDYDPADQATPTVFGYQERWAEYRYGRSYVSGAFRSDFAQSLDAWHLALDFASAPALDQFFIQDNPPVDRVRASSPAEPNNQQFLVDMFFRFRHARLMPVRSVPGLQRL